MELFSVHLEARAPGGVPHALIEDAAADGLMDLLAAHDGIVSVGVGSWGATVSLEGTDPSHAAAVAAAFIKSLASEAGMPSWPIVRVEAVRQDVLEEDNARPTLPRLVSVPEAAEILGVSPQRIHQLAEQHASFPAPVYELRTGKLWLRVAIEAFARRWDRRPGRPRKASAKLSVG